MKHTVAFVLLLVACTKHNKDAILIPDGGGSPDGGIVITTLDMAMADMSKEEAPDLAPFKMAAHASFHPLDSQGGPVLSSPNVITISYSDFAFESDIDTYMTWLMPSAWLTTVGAEYGVGAGTYSHVQVPRLGPTTADYDTLPQDLYDLQNQNIVPTGPDGTIYMFLLSPSTTLTDAPGPCMADYGPAYHSDSLDGNETIFGVVATCAALPLEQVELSLSHEIVEASTDPYPNNSPAYLALPTDPYSAAGGEIADLCDQPYAYSQGTVARTWSNQQAQLGGDPCLPTYSTPWFFTSGDTDTFTLAAGASMTVKLTSWSTAPSPAWDLVAANASSAGDQLVLGINPSTTDNGQTPELQIMVPANAQSGETLLGLVQSSHTDYDYVFWGFAVNVQ